MSAAAVITGPREGRWFVAVGAVTVPLAFTGISPLFSPGIQAALQIGGVFLMLIASGLLSEHWLRGPSFRGSQLGSVAAMIAFLGFAAIGSALSVSPFVSMLSVVGFCILFFAALNFATIPELVLRPGFQLLCAFLAPGLLTAWLLLRVPGERFGGVLHPNYWGLLCLLTVVSSTYVSNKLIRLAVLAISVTILVDAQARGAMLTGSLFLIICYLPQLLSSLRRFIPHLLLLMAGALIAGSYYPAFLEKFGDTVLALDVPGRGFNTGMSGRDELYKMGYDLFATNPWFGVGSRMESHYINTPEGISYAHSGYITTIAEYGMLGSVPLFTFVYFGMRRRLFSLSDGTEESRREFAFVVAYALYAVFEPRFLNIGNPISIIWLIFLLRLPPPKIFTYPIS